MLQSVLDNYEVLLGVWEEAQTWKLDGEMRARIIGVNAQMHMFDFLFGISLDNLLLHHTDNLSATLQTKSLSAAEGQRIARLTLDVLTSLHNESHFALFFAHVIQDQAGFDVDEPAVCRKHRTPKHYQIGTSAGEFHATPEDQYRAIYFEVLDHVTSAIKQSFDQPGYHVYRTVQDLVLKAAQGDDYVDELDEVLKVYGNDLRRSQLHTQLSLLSPLLSEIDSSALTVKSLFRHCQSCQLQNG